MDFLKPPTDNLYKFLAIGGLVVIGFSLYTKHGARNDLIKVIDSFQKEQHGFAEQLLVPQITESLRPPLRKWEPPDPPQGNYLTGDRADRDAWKVVFDNILEISRKNAAPPTPTEMGEYFRRPEVLGYYMLYEGRPEGDFIKQGKTKSYPDFVDLIKDERQMWQSKFREILQFTHALDSTWAVIDEYNAIDAHSKVGFWVGVGMTVFGFGLWWGVLQRHQDKIVKREAKEVKTDRHKPKVIFAYGHPRRPCKKYCVS
jgi:hypothetical protein